MISATSTLVVVGKMVACLGDMVICPMTGHGVTPIIESESSMTCQGKPITLNGHKADYIQ